MKIQCMYEKRKIRCYNKQIIETTIVISYNKILFLYPYVLLYFTTECDKGQGFSWKLHGQCLIYKNHITKGVRIRRKYTVGWWRYQLHHSLVERYHQIGNISDYLSRGSLFSLFVSYAVKLIPRDLGWE